MTTTYDDKDIKTDLSFVKYVVNKFLRQKIHLQVLRQDLEQEGFMALMRARSSYDPTKGVTMETHVYSEVLHALQNFENKEYKHFRNKRTYKKNTKDILLGYNLENEIAKESHLWDIPEAINLEEYLLVEEDITDKDTLSVIFSKVKLTHREKEALDYYLLYSSEGEVAKRLGVSRQRAYTLMREVVRKCRDVVITGT